LSENPEWIKAKALPESDYSYIKKLLAKYNLHTVCQSALCPNIGECWSAKTATFMILGDICTRNCRFCSVKSGNPDCYTDLKEPENIAKAVNELGLKFVVLTSVTRDDLEDGGSEHFAQTIKAIKKMNNSIMIEVLIPDFKGNLTSLKRVIYAKPDILAHNIEVVNRLSKNVRDSNADYCRSLSLLKKAKLINPEITTKSSFMVGLGESFDDVYSTLIDLKNCNIDIVTIGQYLQPTKAQLRVKKFVSPEEFKTYEKLAKEIGIKEVMASPLVRSSYKADILARNYST